MQRYIFPVLVLGFLLFIFYHELLLIFQGYHLLLELFPVFVAYYEYMWSNVNPLYLYSF